MIPIFVDQSGGDKLATFDLPFYGFERDWNDLKSNCPYTYNIALDLKAETPSLCIALNDKTYTTASARESKYCEDLWKGNVLELFIANQGSPAYEEIHHAPDGAWWAQAFSDYRQRADNDRSLTNPGVVTVEIWTQVILMAIPLRVLKTNFSDLDRLLINVTCMSDGKYFSAASFRCDPPDFHRRENLEAPKIIRLS